MFDRARNTSLSRPTALLKNNCTTGALLQILQNILEQLFYKTPMNSCFCLSLFLFLRMRISIEKVTQQITY